MTRRNYLYVPRTCSKCGGKLAPEQKFADNRAFLWAHDEAVEDLTARVRLLEWHGAEAFPVFGELLHRQLSEGRYYEEALDIALNIHVAEVVDVVLAHLGLLKVRKAAIKLAERWPLLVLEKLLDLNPGRHQPAAELLRELLAAHTDWWQRLKSDCDERRGKILARLIEAEAMPEAAIDVLPAILRQPPWRQRPVLPEIPQLDLEPIVEPPRLGRTEAFAEKALTPNDYVEDVEDYYSGTREQTEADVVRKALRLLGARTEALERLVATETGGKEDFAAIDHSSWSWKAVSALCVLPPGLAGLVLRHGDAGYLREMDTEKFRHLLARFGAGIAVPLSRVLDRASAQGPLRFAAVFDADCLAMPLVLLFHRNKWSRPQVRQWLTRYPATAARALIPVALGSEVPARQPARHALRWLAANGWADVVATQAERFGAPAKAALDAVLSIAPEQILPDPLPVLPRDIFLPALPRLVLQADGKAVPVAVMADVLMLLMLSKPDEPYAGLASLQEAVTADSLARLGLALFKRWQEREEPSKERWMFDVQGLIGNDDTARQLGVALHRWRAGLNRVRAYEAMDMLAQIGSDMALMLLDRLRAQTRYNDMHERAGRMIADVAAQRGLTLEELADRTVPDLGLDESGRLTLDFGPRAFHVRFDDALTPFVVDGDGKRLKDLPKPNAKDDPVRAKEAVSRYKDFKKQAKSVTGVQVKRLETAMCARRRWNGDDFMRLFVHHAFARHLSRRLIWGLYDEDDRCIDAFRVAEDRTLADVEDREYRLPAAARIGIAHPLDFGGDLLERCARLLADYEIVQVFPQLGRETFVLTEAAATQRDLPEWPGRRVTVGSLLGIEQRGWRRRVGDGGMIDGFVLAKPNGRRVELAFAPGWFVGEAPPVKDVQEISGVALQGENARWDQFTPVEFSEMQRDLHLMAWFTGP